MILNLLHRAEETPDQQGTFQWQQDLAHRLGLKVTVLLDGRALQNPAVIEQVLRDHHTYGDEIGLWLYNFPAPPGNGGGEPFLWLYSREEKRHILQWFLDLYREHFGHLPRAVGSYHLDRVSMELLRELSPETEVSVAGCFEEGVRVFHGCNHSWYLFNEGGPWGPWYPSKGHSLRPAKDASDWAGVVAMPHLMRDLVLSYEGRNDFFATHPANAQRAMANDGPSHPYDYNLILQHQLQEDFNDGYSFLHVFVGPQWLSGHPTIQDTDEVTRQIYTEYLTHLADMRDRGELIDMHMTEFSRWYQQNVPIATPQVALAKDVLYGSGKHYFWYVDPHFRVLLDAQQGGSIGDLRPYASTYTGGTGPDEQAGMLGTFPYLIQSQHRTGLPNHFRDGSRTTAFVTLGEETIDLATLPAHVAEVQRDKHQTTVRLTPVTLRFREVEALLETTVVFSGEGRIDFIRKLTCPPASRLRFKLREYVKGCWGFTEYPENLRGVVLKAGHETLEYAYRNRSVQQDGIQQVSATVPQIGTTLTLSGAKANWGRITEGFLFNPYYTLELQSELQHGQEVSTCLQVKKA